MKDIVITSNRIKLELRIFLVLWLIANTLNVYAIWRYQTEWSELLTFQFMVMFLSVLLYVALGAARILFHFSKKLYISLRNQ